MQGETAMKWPIAAVLIALMTYFMLIDDGSVATRGYLLGASEPTHKSLVRAAVDYLERH
jgi:hypothetical protein